MVRIAPLAPALGPGGTCAELRGFVKAPGICRADLDVSTCISRFGTKILPKTLIKHNQSLSEIGYLFQRQAPTREFFFCSISIIID